MIDFIKKQWFVAVIAVILLALIVYFIIDTDNSRVKGKKADGQDIVASIDDYNVSADDLYEEMYSSGKVGDKAVIAQFKFAVINEAIPTSSDLKKSAGITMNNYISNVQAQYNYTKSAATKMLESQKNNAYFNGTLEEYFIMQEKEAQFVSNHLDEKVDDIVKPFMKENNVRTLSHILIKVEDIDNVTAEEQQKLDAVKAALDEGKDFGEVAKEFSDDTGSAEKNGYLGYSDKSAQWVPPFLEESLKLEEGQVSSDWIRVTTEDSGGSYSGFHLVKVDVTNPDTLLADREIKQAIHGKIQTNDTNMLNRLVWAKANELGVTFANDELEKTLKDAYDIAENADEE